MILYTRDGIAKIVRIFTEEHVKDHDFVFEAMKEKAISHGEFIEIRNHGRIIVVFIRNIRLTIDFAHLSPLSERKKSSHSR